jgi:excisionase family DNA binding protein
MATIERLTIEQVMDELHCSEYTVYRLMREGLLGYTQVTPTIRLVRRDEVDAFMDNRDIIGKYRKSSLKSPTYSTHLLPPSATPTNLADRRTRAK